MTESGKHAGATSKAQINVSAKIIADISSGIYRSPANALKELISNAWDAGSPNIILTTDYPTFDIFTASDIGEGMTAEKFKDVMSKIGGSDKRDPRGEYVGYTKSGRPIIGKIGIGILAVAQICNKFTVISSIYDDDTRFEATIDLKQFQDEDAYKYNLTDETINIGEYDIIEDIEDDANKQYTQIILEEIDEGFKKRLQDYPIKQTDFTPKDSDPKTFLEFTYWMHDKIVRDLPEYLKLLWDLAQVSPTSYFDNSPIPNSSAMNDIKKELNSHDFTVIVDGIKLMKPISFPYEKHSKDKYFDYKVYDIFFDDDIDGSKLSFSGYIYQQNKGIMPPELRGICIRIRNVGIGGYDKSFLNFPQTGSGIILAGMTSEIYIKEGLESAINIDRDSFRETDLHFLKLQEIIFTELSKGKEKGGILMDARSRSSKIQYNKRNSKRILEYDKIQNILSRVQNKKFNIISFPEYNDKPIIINFKEGEIKIYDKCPIYPRALKERRLYEKFIIFYELVTKDLPNKKKLDELYYNLIKGR